MRFLVVLLLALSFTRCSQDMVVINSTCLEQKTSSWCIRYGEPYYVVYRGVLYKLVREYEQ